MGRFLKFYNLNKNLNKRPLSFFLFFLIFIAPLSLSYAKQLEPLAVEQAFSLSITPQAQGNDLKLHWKIAPNHYLYQDKIEVYSLNANPIKLPLILPKAKILPNALLGSKAVYEQTLTLLIKPPQDTTELSIQYQGCSAEGFCYPPQKISYAYPNRMNQALQHANPATRLGLFYLLGLLLAFTPCVLPMLPILASVIITEEKLSTLKGFFLSLSYVMSMATTYAVAGVLAVKMGQSLPLLFQHVWVITGFALFFVYLGLVQLNKLPLRLPQKLSTIFHAIHAKQQGGHILGAVILGFLATLIASPCISAPLMATLSYIAQTGNLFLGGSSLFVMGLGMGTPMILLGTLGGRYIPKTGKWMQLVNELFALLLFGLAIWILGNVLAPNLIMGLWGILAILAAYFMGVLNKRTYHYLPNLPKIGIVILIYGLMLILSAVLGHTNPFRPFPFHASFAQVANLAKLNAESHFISVNNLQSLNTELKKYTAHRQHKDQLILIDFYADWCAACKHMDVALFQDPEVLSLIQNWTRIKADITENGPEQRALMKAYQVFAPPSLYLLKVNQVNQPNPPYQVLQLHGAIAKKEFIAALTKFTTKPI